MATQADARRVRTDPRISRRRRAVERGKRRRVIVSLAALGSLVLLVVIAFWSPLLEVRKVQVVGAKHTDAADVREATGLDEGPNLLLVSTGDVASSVETLPWVRSADVHRRLPGTVRVKLVERTPALVVTVAAGTWTIDGSGHVLEEGAVTKDLPTLTGSVIAGLEPGERLDAPEIKAGLAVWRSLPKKIKAEVASVVAASRERVALILRDGTMVRYGGAEGLRSKNEVLLVLLRRLDAEGRSATYVDISVPTSPAIGPAPATAAPTPTPTL
jgi:cell division protein FtsQ